MTKYNNEANIPILIMLSNYNNTASLFQKIGLSAKESHAFLELVQLGSCPVSVWAKHSKINRSSMYVLLNRFESLGLITSFVHQGVKHVQAVAMAELPAILFDKQQKIEQTRELFVKNLPDLQKLEKNHNLIPKIVFYEGRKKVEMMYENAIKEGSFKSFFNPKKIKEYLPEYFYKIPESIKSGKKTAKELLIDCEEAREYQKIYSSNKHEIKILNSNIQFSSDIIITDEKIFLVGYSDNDVVATEIWNKELAVTQSVIFDMVWSAL